MRIRIDAEGGLTIPRELLDEAGLDPGTDVDVWPTFGRLQVERGGLPIRFEERDDCLIAVRDGPMPILSTNAGQQVIEEMRMERDIHNLMVEER